MNSKKTCIYCTKQYVREKSLSKHQIMCEMVFNKRSTVNSEDDEPVYTLKQLNTIIKELVLKNAKLEEDVKELKKHLLKEKKKFNVIDWLSTNIITTYSFDEIIDKITVEIKHVEYMRYNKLLDTIYLIIDDHIRLEQPDEDDKHKRIPIVCISEKILLIFFKSSDLNSEGLSLK